MNADVNLATRASSAKRKNASMTARNMESARITNVSVRMDISEKTALYMNAPIIARRKAHVIAKLVNAHAT